MFATLSGGVMADKFSKNPMAYSRICQVGSLIGIPTFLASMFLTNNFWLSMLATCIRYFLSETYWSPNITMITKACPQSKLSNYVSAYQFFTIMAGMTSMVVFGSIVNYLNCANNPIVLGRLLAVFLTFGFTGSIIAWEKAGNAFKKM